MLNEDKIRQMTSIGMFEKKEGAKIFPVNRFFRSDYIGRYILRSFLGFTFCWLLGTVVVVLYRSEELLTSLNFSELQASLKLYLTAYFAGMAVYLLITCMVYWRRYDYASRGMKIYAAKLRRLERRYELQGKTGQGQGGRRV